MFMIVNIDNLIGKGKLEYRVDMQIRYYASRIVSCQEDVESIDGIR